jgi:hypothetical protein
MDKENQGGYLMDAKKIYYKNLSDTIIKNLEKRQMEGYFFETATDAIAYAESYFFNGCAVGYGGSTTLTDCGMMDILRSNQDIVLYDRENAKNPEELHHIYHQSFDTDYFFMSSNAITTQGELVNIDGTGNRVAALIYGPKNVILFIGMNKVCRDVNEAIQRVHNVASPTNCNRLNRKTPCALTGVCADCLSPDCICNQTVITRRSGTPGRIKVFLIGEELGY